MSTRIAWVANLFTFIAHCCFSLGHFKFQSTSSPLMRSKSPATPTTPKTPRTALAEAQEFIDEAEEVDLTSDPGGRTALHLAIVHCHSKVVDILLQHKGDNKSRRNYYYINIA